MRNKYVCDVKNSRQGRDLLISVNDRVISPIREDFLSYAKFRENKTLAKISELTEASLGARISIHTCTYNTT